jgi:hypothetical protein
MTAWKKSAIALLAAACISGAADPALLKLVPPNSRVVAGANLSQFLASPFGKFVFSQAQSTRPQFQQMLEASGFDPLRDLQEILVASQGGQKENRGLVLMKGVFDPAKLAALAQKSGAAVQTYRGVQVMTGKQKTDGWFAFLDPMTAALGDAASVQDLIDRPASARGLEPALRARIDKASTAYDFWVVSTVPPSQFAGDMPSGQLNGVMQGDVLKGILETSGGVRFGPDILIAGEALTRSEKDAAALADVVRFFVGLAQMSAQKDPKAAASLAFLQKLQLSAEGSVMRLSLTVPQADLEKFIQQVQAAAKQQAAAVKNGSAPAAGQPSQEAPPPPSGGLVIRSSPKDMGTVVVK